MEQIILSLKTYEELKDRAEGKNKELERKIETLNDQVVKLRDAYSEIKNKAPRVEENIYYDEYSGFTHTTISFKGIDEIKKMWEQEGCSEVSVLKKKLAEKDSFINEILNEVNELKHDRDEWIEIAVSKKSLFQRIFGS